MTTSNQHTMVVAKAALAANKANFVQMVGHLLETDQLELSHKSLDLLDKSYDKGMQFTLQQLSRKLKG